MEELKDKAYRTYDYISRYAPFPYFYNVVDDKYIYGMTANLEKTDSYILHNVRNGETFDSIALQYYNNPTLYWVICDFNGVRDPFLELFEGMLIKVPSLGTITWDMNK